MATAVEVVVEMQAFFIDGVAVLMATLDWEVLVDRVDCVVAQAYSVEDVRRNRTYRASLIRCYYLLMDCVRRD